MTTLSATIVGTDSFLLQKRNATIQIKLVATVAHPTAKLKLNIFAIRLSKMSSVQASAWKLAFEGGTNIPKEVHIAPTKSVMMEISKKMMDVLRNAQSIKDGNVGVGIGVNPTFAQRYVVMD
jgi:ribosomal protein L11